MFISIFVWIYEFNSIWLFSYNLIIPFICLTQFLLCQVFTISLAVISFLSHQCWGNYIFLFYFCFSFCYRNIKHFCFLVLFVLLHMLIFWKHWIMKELNIIYKYIECLRVLHICPAAIPSLWPAQWSTWEGCGSFPENKQ